MERDALAERLSSMEKRVASLERRLSACPEAGRRMLTTEEAARFLGMTVDGLRGLTHKKLISYYKPNGKNMYFDVNELASWQKRNHFEPVAPLEDSREN